MDLYWDKTYRKEQQDAFIYQLELAAKYDVPIVIHARETIDIMIELVSKYKKDNTRGVFHCFTGTAEQGQKIIDLGFYIGIGGVLTFKNAGLDTAVEPLPLDYMVLETDSPYLAPAPNRGKRNEPSYLTYVASRLAQVKNIAIEEVAQVTTRNALTLYDA
jgi:TatD DNase family protein